MGSLTLRRVKAVTALLKSHSFSSKHLEVYDREKKQEWVGRGEGGKEGEGGRERRGLEREGRRLGKE